VTTSFGNIGIANDPARGGSGHLRAAEPQPTDVPLPAQPLYEVFEPIYSCVAIILQLVVHYIFLP